MREFVVGGLLISPLVKYALIAGLVYVPVKLVLVRFGLQRWFWHPHLAEAALYLCILATLNLLV
jgi:hypothetical protein